MPNFLSLLLCISLLAVLSSCSSTPNATNQDSTVLPNVKAAEAPSYTKQAKLYQAYSDTFANMPPPYNSLGVMKDSLKSVLKNALWSYVNETYVDKAVVTIKTSPDVLVSYTLLQGKLNGKDYDEPMHVAYIQRTNGIGCTESSNLKPLVDTMESAFGTRSSIQQAGYKLALQESLSPFLQQYKISAPGQTGLDAGLEYSCKNGLLVEQVTVGQLEPASTEPQSDFPPSLGTWTKENGKWVKVD